MKPVNGKRKLNIDKISKNDNSDISAYQKLNPDFLRGKAYRFSGKTLWFCS